MPLKPCELSNHDGYFYIMAMSSVFTDYFQEYGMKLPEEHENFIYFEGKISVFPRKNAKEPKWAFSARALNKAKISFQLYPENLGDCFSIEDDMQDLILYTHVDMEGLYNNDSSSNEGSSDEDKSSSEEDEDEGTDEDSSSQDDEEEASTSAKGSTEQSQQTSNAANVGVLPTLNLTRIMSPEAAFTSNSSSSMGASKSTINSAMVSKTRPTFSELDDILRAHYGSTDVLKKAPEENHKKMLTDFIESGFGSRNQLVARFIEIWMDKFENYDANKNKISSPFTRAQARNAATPPASEENKVKKKRPINKEIVDETYNEKSDAEDDEDEEEGKTTKKKILSGSSKSI